MLSFTYTRTCLSRRRVPSRGPPRPAWRPALSRL